MPRRTLLTPAERGRLLALPEGEDEWIRYYRLSETDLSLIRQKRGAHNRLGFAAQLCWLRYPGALLPPGAPPPAALLRDVARQLRVRPEAWGRYAEREKTRREHLQELQEWLGVSLFGAEHYRAAVEALTELATQTDQGILLATAMLAWLRQQRVVVPPIDVVERACAEALTRGTRRVYAALTAALGEPERTSLDGLIELRENARISTLAWMRQPPGPAASRSILAHLERLQAVQDLALPEGLSNAVHQNRWMKLAREGGR